MALPVGMDEFYFFLLSFFHLLPVVVRQIVYLVLCTSSAIALFKLVRG